MENIIFDFDGTLVDSAPAILACFEQAFAACNIPLARELNASVIGPPLLDTLRLLSGRDDKNQLGMLAEAFKRCYDSEGYRLTTVYAGVEHVLRELTQSGFRMFIATNKRKIPTEKIIEQLAWGRYFEGVYSLDSMTPPAKSKGVLLQQLLQQCQLAPNQSIYIGDRNEDGLAAQSAAVEFILASWGYNETSGRQWRVATSPEALLVILKDSIGRPYTMK